MAEFKGFKAYCQGFSHVKSGAVCQDAAAFYYDEKWAVCVVSDGHGSEKYFRSDVGAQKAVETSLEAVGKFVEKQPFQSGNAETADQDQIAKKNEKKLQELACFIVAKWIDRIEEHWDTTPCTEKEKLIYEKCFNAAESPNISKIYGATLIIGVLAEKFSFIIQIGDGAACIIKADGTKGIPAETVDENQFGGYTNSLSSSDCLPRFRFYYTEEPLKAIIVTSDGVTDSYGGNEGNDFLNFCGTLVDLYADDYEQAQGFLEDWLPKLSEKGSQDDMSVAGVFALVKTHSKI